MQKLSEQIYNSTSFRKIRDRIKIGTKRVNLHGLAGSLGAFLIASFVSHEKLPIVAVTSDEDQAENLRDDLETILGADAVKYFPSWEAPPYEEVPLSVEKMALRVEALWFLANQSRVAVTTSVRALMYPVIPPKVLRRFTLQLEVGQEISLDSLLNVLINAGFERTPSVENVGQISLRGGILDIFPFMVENPVRLEFFGDEIESMREFDPSSQRSLRAVERVTVPPCHEVVLDNEIIEASLGRIKTLGEDEISGKAILAQRLSQRILFDGIQNYLRIIYGENTSLLDYIGPDTLLFLNEPSDIENEADRLEYEFHSAWDKRLGKDQTALAPKHTIYDQNQINGKFRHLQCVRNYALKHRQDIIEIGARSQRRLEGDLKVLRKELTEFDREGFRSVILCDNTGQAERFSELLAGHIDPDAVLVGSLHGGFIFPEAQIALFNDHEIFGRLKRKYRFHKFKGTGPLPSFTALKKGDYVVHIDYGVARYQGLQELILDGRKHECLLLLYQDNDKLYVPVDQFDRIQKYSSAEGQVPVLSRLGGTGWEKLKAATKKSIVKMAEELIRLHAERKAKPGFAFSSDSEWQKELEASFIYEETPDQLRATEEIKTDLERSAPMDRLVCGDVGYGKTEVAIRAAFKAVTDDKQVAVLVPTTILAQQHYATFNERISNFPVKIEVLSRFRTEKEQKEVAKELKSGTVDIVVGTHRLLSKDIDFKNLGLVVVDEEHLFGVVHKEKLKRLCRQVDVLTLTATPIPRTLHMSLLGVRDMSVINTPPRDRLPVHTEIIHFRRELIAEAIMREIDRGGQVFFVHNRVQSIDAMAEFLEELLPNIRFAVAHGQMSERHLEKVMLDFMSRKYDCLVSTMIIESGLDIPNVNTIIINRADRFGLAQLYQLRGRVGRSNRRAFAYLVVPPEKSLSTEARQRLRAIEEFTELGSGFKIAMRDLEIRGAGNLLGKEQHGYIAAVGFELYCQLLEEAISELKGEKKEEYPEPKIEIKVSALLPEDYVPDTSQRVDMYQRIAKAKTPEEVLEIEEELRDRFGKFPPQTQALVDSAYIRVFARQLGIEILSLSDGRLRMVFPLDRKLTSQEAKEMIKRSPITLEFSFARGTIVSAKLPIREEEEILTQAKSVLKKITEKV